MCRLEAVLKILDLTTEVSGGCVEGGERALSPLVAAGGRFPEISQENQFSVTCMGELVIFICVELNLWVSEVPCLLA